MKSPHQISLRKDESDLRLSVFVRVIMQFSPSTCSSTLTLFLYYNVIITLVTPIILISRKWTGNRCRRIQRIGNKNRKRENRMKYLSYITLSKEVNNFSIHHGVVVSFLSEGVIHIRFKSISYTAK